MNATQRQQNISHLRSRLIHYAHLMRWHRPIGTLLLLWPTLWALWIAAEGIPPLSILTIFVSGVFVMRSAGCVINDFADRNFDAHVQRTQDRPLAVGTVSPREALVLFVVLLVIAAQLVLWLNALTIKLALAGVLITTVYPFLKRYTYLPQFVMGMAFSWGIPMAFAAQTGQVPMLAWLLFTANLLWAVVYDTIYAMVDRDDDIKLGLKSTAILFDDMDRPIIGVIQTLTLIALVMVSARAELGVLFLLALFVAAILFAYQQMLIKDRDRDQCFRAFLNNNWFGAIIFIGIVLDYGLR